MKLREYLEKEELDTLDERYRKRRDKLLAKRQTKRLARTSRLTIADIEYALYKNKGNLHKTAEFLGTTRDVIKFKIDKMPYLQRIQEQIREEVIDMAEQKLVEQVEEGYFPAVSLVLKTLGKNRGYTERATMEHELGENAARSAAELIELMRTGARQEAESAKTIEAKDYKWLEDKSEKNQEVESLPKSE